MLSKMGLLFGLDEKSLCYLLKWHFTSEVGYNKMLAININPQMDEKSLELNLSTEQVILVRFRKPKLITEL